MSAEKPLVLQLFFAKWSKCSEFYYRTGTGFYLYAGSTQQPQKSSFHIPDKLREEIRVRFPHVYEWMDTQPFTNTEDQGSREIDTFLFEETGT